MTLQQVSDFFLWCSLINGGLLLFWILIFRLAPELVYRTQQGWFTQSREQFDLMMYGFLGLFKIGFLFLNLTPYLALQILL